MEIGREEDDLMTRLYEASMQGSIVDLKLLIQKDPLILNKISLTTFAETPLHISAVLGHLCFTRQLVAIKPKLASELDSLGRSPLHLASAEGHAEIVQELLQVREDMCLVRDEGGRIPLHYAAMRGRVDLIKLLAKTRQCSVFEVLPDGETVLHLCVLFNHLEALKLLVELVGHDNKEFLNLKEHTGGNTILHLSANYTQILAYLLSVPGVKAGAEESLNHRGMKAFDLIEYHFPRDFKTLQIQRNILMNAETAHHTGVSLQVHKADHRRRRHHRDHVNNATTTIDVPPAMSSSTTSWWGEWIRYIQYKGEWMQDRPEAIMVVATVIASMAFGSSTNPPGGVWQNNINTAMDGVDCSQRQPCIVGTSVFARSSRISYKFFLIFNSTSFLASICVILLLVCAVPLKNTIYMFLLIVALCGAVTSLALSFLIGTTMVTPQNDFEIIQKISDNSSLSLFILIGFIFLAHAIRCLSWIAVEVVGHCFNKKCEQNRSDISE